MAITTVNRRRFMTGAAGVGALGAAAMFRPWQALLERVLDSDPEVLGGSYERLDFV